MTEQTPPTAGGGTIERVDLQQEMQRSYLDYAMSVIVGRALPDVRDGLKPVHRRVLYGMYDGGYRPDRSFSKCSRVVGDVMGQYHPHGDGAIYDTLVRLVQPWSLRYPLISGQGNFGSPGNDRAAAPRYTECRMAPLAMEMVRDIDKETVDFQDNYDGKTKEPVVLPSRFPNLLANGSAGIAVGMATNIPPHNLTELNAGIQWFLENPDMPAEEALEGLIQRIPGPDFPTGAMIMGKRGIVDAYRTGRGSITMRAIVNVEEIENRTCLVVTELPYMVNPDNLAEKIADLIRSDKLQGIADVRDETSGRTGQRLVLVLKRDAVAKVVLNNLYKHTQLQDTFGANMLALVDGVPRTLSLDAFIRHWVTHQIDVVVRRTQYLLREAQQRAHIVRALLKALDMLDEVIALIRSSATTEVARTGLMDLLDIDEIQANAILDLQLRRLAALERQKLREEYDELMAKIADYEDILATPQRQRDIVSSELQEITDRFGDERRTHIEPFDGDMSVEDLIPEEDVVVTITAGGYAKRTKMDAYRSQRRGGKGVKGASLKGDDVVEHFFATTTHHWLLCFTNQGRVYRAKAYELPETGRDSRGQHVANLLEFAPDEVIVEVLAIRAYDQAPYLVLATRSGLVKKTRLSDYDSNRSGGLIAVNLRQRPDGSTDEVVAARLTDSTDDVLLVSRKGQSLRFTVTDEALRPMGRATSGVTGMKFRDGDELLAMDVVPMEQRIAETAHAEGDLSDAELATEQDVFVMFAGGLAKRTAVGEYRVQGRGGLGIRVAKLTERGGDLVGAVLVHPSDEVMVVMEGGKVVRSRADEVRRTGRDTSGVKFATPDQGDTIIAVTSIREPIEDDSEEENMSSSESVGDGVPSSEDHREGDQ